MLTAYAITAGVMLTVWLIGQGFYWACDWICGRAQRTQVVRRRVERRLGLIPEPSQFAAKNRDHGALIFGGEGA